jgi:hypothetical protein
VCERESECVRERVSVSVAVTVGSSVSCDFSTSSKLYSVMLTSSH